MRYIINIREPYGTLKIKLRRHRKRERRKEKKMTIYTKCTECGKELHFNGIKSKGAAYKQKWYDANCVCDDCRKKAYFEKIEKQAESQKDFIESLNLPELHGTDKQIAWAKSLRANMLKGLVKFRDKVVSNPKVVQEAKDYVTKTVDEFLTSTRASFFIDYRKLAEPGYTDQDYAYWFNEHLDAIWRRKKPDVTK